MSVSDLRESLRHPVRAYRRRVYRRHGFRSIARRGIALSHAALGHEAYQEMYGFEDLDQPAERNTKDRWELMAPHLDGVGSSMDIGCQNGWFVFKMAEVGIYSIGVDVLEKQTRVAQWLTIGNASNRAAFFTIDVTPESAARLPAVDVVSCLSVFQHWVTFHDLEYATSIMRALAGRCSFRMFFETGAPGERGRAWNKLSFLGTDQRSWTDAFLRSLEFSKVEVLGTTPGWKGIGSRDLYMATR